MFGVLVSRPWDARPGSYRKTRKRISVRTGASGVPKTMVLGHAHRDEHRFLQKEIPKLTLKTRPWDEHEIGVFLAVRRSLLLTVRRNAPLL